MTALTTVSDTTSDAPDRGRARLWVRRTGLGRKIPAFLVGMGLFSGILTYVVLSGWAASIHDPGLFLALLTGNLVLLAVIGFLVGRRIWTLVLERRRAVAGSKLYGRLILLFGVIALSPALLVAGFSVAFFEHGLQAWFNEKVRTAIDESTYIAQSYLREHQQNIRDDVLGIAEFLKKEGSGIYARTDILGDKIATVALSRSIPELVVFERNGRLRAKYGESFIIETEPEPPSWAFEDADQGKVALLTSEKSDRVRALLRLDRAVPTYLYAGRFIDPQVLHRVEESARAVAEYEDLLANLSGIEANFSTIFLVVNLMLLLVAIWGGLHVASSLVHPFGQLIEAAGRVRNGDMSARVAEGDSGGVLSGLGHAFNLMTGQLESQRTELVTANRKLEERGQFMETVLSGVSAGVIGLDGHGVVTLPNRSAFNLLDLKQEMLIGRPLGQVVPEMAPLLEQVTARPGRLGAREIRLSRRGRSVTLLVRAVAERGHEGITGYVVTFDDISDLLRAQRKAAWGDVARRIAHEIKNPLTPIQLSAERLRRRYLKRLDSDREVFSACTDTIIRQVGDIGRMVDEFSAFARMPPPVMEMIDLDILCQQAVLLQEAAYPHIVFEYRGDPLKARIDSRQINQLLNNLIKNAAESINTRCTRDSQDKKNGSGTGNAGEKQGYIHLTLRPVNKDCFAIVIDDDGGGFPEDRDKLIEPYVTTREKGTGLGLAVVAKIVDDHAGHLHLEDYRPKKGGRVGARVRIVLPFDARSHGTKRSDSHTSLATSSSPVLPSAGSGHSS